MIYRGVRGRLVRTDLSVFAVLLHILELDPAIVAPRFFRVGDSLELSFENFLLCLEQKLLFDTLVLRLDILLFSNKVLVAFQDVDLDTVEVCAFLVTQPAEFK